MDPYHGLPSNVTQRDVAVGDGDGKRPIRMKAISFAWTTPALLAGAKSVTRREWPERYARQFRGGETVLALNKSYRAKGRAIAVIRLSDDPRLEPDIDAPDSDYEAEGFSYLAEHPAELPKSARNQARMTLSREAFDEWRKAGGFSWVIRFEVVEIL